jgi:hypothetical protein
MCARKSIFGIAAFLVLALAVTVVGSASAEQRAYTCSKTASTLQFSDSRCLNTVGTHEYGHTLITGVTTEVQGTNAETSSTTTEITKSVLASVVAGAEFEIDCAIVEGTGTLTDKTTWVEGVGTVKYKNCTVDKPIGKGCVVESAAGEKGVIETETLKLTTQGQSTGKVLVSPAGATALALINFKMCTLPALNIAHVLSGSLVEEAGGPLILKGPVLTSSISGVKKQATLEFDKSKNTGLGGAVTMGTKPVGPETGIALT